MEQKLIADKLDMRIVEWLSYNNTNSTYIIGDETTVPKIVVKQGYFHRWLDNNKTYEVCALVELMDGTLTEVEYNKIKFI